MGTPFKEMVSAVMSDMVEKKLYSGLGMLSVPEDYAAKMNAGPAVGSVQIRREPTITQAYHRDFVDPMQMIAMRLRWPPHTQLPFEFIQAHLDNKSAFVFVVTNGKPVTLEDDVNLFPSDNLITQLRVLVGNPS